MARQINGINGGFSGRFGEAVGYEMGGKFYLRSRPKWKKKYKPSPKQALRQSKFAWLQHYFNPLKFAFAFGWKHSVAHGRYMATAGGYHLKLVEESGNSFRIDPEKLLLSRGSLEPAQQLRLSRQNNKLTARWNAQQGEVSDRAVLLAFLPHEETIFMDMPSARRLEGKISLALPAGFKNAEADVYFFFVSLFYTDASNSQYLGRIALE